jgi:hypothetical protein
MQSVFSAAASAAGRPLPQQLVTAVQREVELVQEVLDRERRLQRELLARAFAPSDAVFDLLEQSGAALHRQSQALQESARALEQAARMMEVQAELFERAIQALREPAEMARSAVGLERRRPRHAPPAPPQH